MHFESPCLTGSTNGTSSADSTSTSTPATGMIARAGMSLPARHSATALCLDFPLTRNITCRARLSRAALNDTRCGGGLGASNTASVSGEPGAAPHSCCLLYTSDAADDLLCVDLGGRR